MTRIATFSYPHAPSPSPSPARPRTLPPQAIDALMAPAPSPHGATPSGFTSSACVAGGGEGGGFFYDGGLIQAEPQHTHSDVSEDFGSPRADGAEGGEGDEFSLEGIDLAQLETLVAEQARAGGMDRDDAWCRGW